MEPKKNKGADLEGKRSLFFLIGIALSLTAAILIIQYERGVITPVLKGDTPVVDIGDDIEITVWETEKAEPKPEKKLTKPNELPPVEVPDNTKLPISELFSSDPPEIEGLVDIDKDDRDLNNVETVEFVFLENIARPKECEGISDKKAQKACFNEWIQKFIAQNTHYPEQAVRMNLQDKVYVTFIISENGDVEDVSIGKGEYDILNKEALRVLQSLPQMTPGSQHHKNVKMRMTVPVNFKLDNR